MTVKTVKVGDTVMWSGCFGMEEPKEAKVVSMEITEDPRCKYGEPANEVDVQLIKENRVNFVLDNNHWSYAEQITPMEQKKKPTISKRKLPKGESKSIDFTFQESSAILTVKALKEHGIRAKYQQRSCSIEGEPYVEHTYVIIVDYVHIDEYNCAKRILCLP